MQTHTAQPITDLLSSLHLSPHQSGDSLGLQTQVSRQIDVEKVGNVGNVENVDKSMFDLFIGDIADHSGETYIHLYRTAKCFEGILEDDKWAWRAITDPYISAFDLYFLAGVRKECNKRACDSDVLSKKLITVDFDIRNQLEKQGLPSKDDDVIRVAHMILGILDRAVAPYCLYRYSFNSGNGLHVHYIADKTFILTAPDGLQWKMGMKSFFNSINEILLSASLGFEMQCDMGCHNPARIMRVPYSWNMKGVEKGIEKKRVYLIRRKDCWVEHLSFICLLGELALIEEKKVKEAKSASDEKNKMMSLRADVGMSTEDNTITAINAIPIEKIVGVLLGCSVGKRKGDGGLRFIDSTGKERGFFKHRQYNVVVHEGTGLFNAPTGSGVGYNPFGLVREVLGLDTTAVIDWFCKQSPYIAGIRDKCNDDWKRDRTRQATLGVMVQLDKLRSGSGTGSSSTSL